MRALVFALALTGCAYFRGQEPYNGPRRVVFYYHEHLRYYDFDKGFVSKRAIWITNGTDTPIRVNVDCGMSGEFIDYPIPPRTSQGFAEWRCECRLRGVL